VTGAAGPGAVARRPQLYPAPDDDALVLPVDQHVAVHVVAQGVDMGGIFILSLKRGTRTEQPSALRPEPPPQTPLALPMHCTRQGQAAGTGNESLATNPS